MLGVVVYICGISIWEVEMGGSGVQGHPQSQRLKICLGYRKPSLKKGKITAKMDFVKFHHTIKRSLF